jgi:hypothetical protein
MSAAGNLSRMVADFEGNLHKSQLVVAELKGQLSQIEKTQTNPTAILGAMLLGIDVTSADALLEGEHNLVRTAREMCRIVTTLEQRLADHEETLRLLMGLGKEAPSQEVWDRAKKFGEIFDSVMTRYGGGT